MTQAVTRYHPLLVAFHWLLALLILGMLVVGVYVTNLPNADPGKIAVLRVHMAVGMLVLALMLVRFVVRLTTSKPPRATTGRPLLDRLAALTHYGFYLLVVAMVATGFATGLLADLPAIVFAGSGDPLPEKFGVYPTFLAHAALAALLVALIALHIAAAVWHQLKLQDGLLGRMGFGRRTP